LFKNEPTIDSPLEVPFIFLPESRLYATPAVITSHSQLISSLS